MININNISKAYNQMPVIENASQTFPDKGLIYILGESGSGKSTLFNLIAGFDYQDKGSISVFSLEVNKLKSKELAAYHHSLCGVILQENILIPYLTILENIQLICGLNYKIINNFIRIIHDFKLEDKLQHYPYQLSGGEAQRISLARTLAFDYPLILADEPTGSLDYTNGTFIIKELKKYSKNKLVIIITHDQRLISKNDQVIKIVDKKIIGDIAKYSEVVHKLSSKKIDFKILMKINFNSIKNRPTLMLLNILTLSSLLLILLVVLTISSNLESFIRYQTESRLDSNYLVVQTYQNNKLVELDSTLKSGISDQTEVSFDLEPIIESFFKESSKLFEIDNFEVKLVDTIEDIAVNNLFHELNKSNSILLNGSIKVPLQIEATYYELVEINLKLNYTNIVEEINLYNTPKIYINQEYLLSQMTTIELPLIAGKLGLNDLSLSQYLKEHTNKLNYISTRLNYFNYTDKVQAYNTFLESPNNFRFYEIITKSNFNIIKANDEMLLKTFKDIIENLLLIIKIIIGSLSFSVITVISLTLAFSFKKRLKELTLLKVFGSDVGEIWSLLVMEVGFIFIVTSILVGLSYLVMIGFFNTYLIKSHLFNFKPKFINFTSIIILLSLTSFILLVSIIDPYLKIKRLKISELIKND